MSQEPSGRFQSNSGWFFMLISTIGSLGCTGVEADVLSLRGGADLFPPSNSLDGGEMRPSSPRCLAREQGDLISCQASFDWQASALFDCRSRGQGLEALSFLTTCGEHGFRSIRYLCCPPSTEPTTRILF